MAYASVTVAAAPDPVVSPDAFVNVMFGTDE